MGWDESKALQVGKRGCGLDNCPIAPNAKEVVVATLAKQHRLEKETQKLKEKF